MNGRTKHLVCGTFLALLATVACTSEPSDEAETKSNLVRPNGNLMPFGGLYNTCVAVVGSGLQVAACGGNNQIFTVNGSELRTQSGQCVDVRFGDLSAGVIDVTGCNGTVNQRWTIRGGEIVSANSSDGRIHVLDVQFGNISAGTPIDLAPRNGTDAQVFWAAGYNTSIRSSFRTSLGGSPTCECMDVLNDNERAGTGLDQWACNQSNAQWFVLDTNHHMRLANNLSLCVGLSGAVQNGLAPIALETCNASDLTQSWFMLNQGPGGSGVRIANMSAHFSGGCLDVQGGSAALGTPIDDFTCNGTAAQLWFPELTVSSCAG